MAVTSVSSQAANWEYTTELKDSVTKAEATIVTNTDAKRVTSINVYIIGDATNDSANNTSYSDAKKKAVHNAVVAAITGKFGDGI